MTIYEMKVCYDTAKEAVHELHKAKAILKGNIFLLDFWEEIDNQQYELELKMKEWLPIIENDEQREKFLHEIEIERGL